MEQLSGAGERGILRNRAFLALWAAQILSQVAANATTFALIVLVGEITKSNTSSSILILLAIVPAVLFVVFASMFGGAALLCLTVPDVRAVRSERIGVDVAGAAVAQTVGGVGEAFAYLRTHPPVLWSLVYIALTYMLIAVAGALAPG